MRSDFKFGIALLGLLFGLGGCCCGPNRDVPSDMHTTIKLDDSLTAGGAVPTMDVDIVGVSEDDLDKWKNVSINSYFTPGNQLRADSKEVTKTFSFGQGQPTMLVLSPDDVIWKVWRDKDRGVKYLVILADLPGTHTDQPGDLDPRRKILPMESYRWPDKTLTITVMPSGISNYPAAQPEQK